MSVMLLARGAEGQSPTPGIRQLHGAGLRPGWDVSLGVKARISGAVAVHRQSWERIWGCSWGKAQRESLRLKAAPRERRGGPC